MEWRFTIAVLVAVLSTGSQLIQAQNIAADEPGSLQLVKLMVDDGVRMSPLHPAPARNPLADESGKLASGLTFDLSVTPREYSFAELFLNSDASPLASNYSPASAMLLALGLRDLRLLERLLDKGIDPNVAFDHPAPAGLVNLFENPFVVRELTKDTRVTPLMLAVLTRQTDAVRILMRRGANTELCTRGLRMYPLDFAAELADIPMMQLLLHQEPAPDGAGRRVIVSLSAQKAWLMHDNNVLIETNVSTGRPGFATRTGEFVITHKYPEWKSTLYKASMPNFMRLNCSQAGLHSGYVPVGTPASHGCIRLPPANASTFYTIVRLGDRVSIVE